MRRSVSPLVPLASLPLALVLAACGGGGASPAASAPAVSAPPSVAPPSLAAPSASPAASAPQASAPAASPAGSGATTEIVGVEYAFENVPATTSAGTTFTLRNGGQELHEMVVVKRNEGVTQTFDELLELPDSEAFEFITPVGQVMAAPGQVAEGGVTVSEPGDYLMVCFIPVGMTELPSGSLGPDASIPAGPPHFTQGMRAEFTVQ